MATKRDIPYGGRMSPRTFIFRGATAPTLGQVLGFKSDGNGQELALVTSASLNQPILIYDPDQTEDLSALTSPDNKAVGGWLEGVVPAKVSGTIEAFDELTTAANSALKDASGTSGAYIHAIALQAGSNGDVISVWKYAAPAYRA